LVIPTPAQPPDAGATRDMMAWGVPVGNPRDYSQRSMRRQTKWHRTLCPASTARKARWNKKFQSVYPGRRATGFKQWPQSLIRAPACDGNFQSTQGKWLSVGRLRAAWRKKAWAARISVKVSRPNLS
jgi:hypothetical protein